MPARRAAAALFVCALVPTLVVALPAVGASAADPHPVAPTIHSLTLNGVDARALTAARRSPAPADGASAWTRETTAGETPAVLTGELKTAGFSAVGVTWTRPPAGSPPADLRVAVRTFDGSWQPWTTLEADADLPSGGTAGQSGQPGADRGNGRAGTDPYFAGPSNGVQVRVDVVEGSLPAGLRVELIDPGTSAADSRLQPSAISTAAAAAALPAIVTRAQWGADESLRNGSPTYDSTVKMAFIHHTASSNSYTKAQAAAAVRSIYAYDTKGLGWSDIAYNVLVDKYGQVFEGRAGGIERAVRSAATGGFNPQTFSVSALGTYVDVAPTSAMVSSIERVLAWKLGLYHLDPFGHARLVASSADGTTSRYANGTAHTFSVISGHRDAGLTQCPGNLLYAKLPAIRTAVKKLIGAAILSPTTSAFVMDKGSAAPVVIKARVMTAQQWRLQVANSAGKVVRTLNGSAAAAGGIAPSWNGNAASGNRVSAGVYTLTLSSWSSASTAVPYLVNVAVDPDPDVYQPAVSGAVLKLKGLGYGHGHGMSQFGAAGAAVKGLTAPQIVAFYFPGTKLETAPTTARVRVRLLAGTHSVAGAPDVRVKPSAGLYVSDGTRVLKLPAKIGAATISAWRARLNSKGHLDLYGVHAATSTPLKGWTGLSTVLRFTSTPGAAFTTPPGAPTTSRVTVITSSGGTRTYRGTVEASPAAAGSSLAAVSEVRLDDYIKSVVSAELPGGWKDAAYQAQAIAARSYALYKQQHASSSARWELVDSTSDQVYLGFSGETSPESKAGTATAGEYLSYQGKAAFAQYSSSDGGWTSAGSQPYLPAKADPYDGVLTGASNWGHAWTAGIPASSIQRAWPSVGRLKSVTAVSRDGHGSWGGRPTSVRILGSSGQVTVTGASFRSGLRLRSDWWSVSATPLQPTWPPSVPPSTVPAVPTVSTAPELVRVAPHDRSAVVSWRTPVNDGNSTITGYRVTVSPVGRTYNVGARTRSVSLPSLVNGLTYTVRVAALNEVGVSATSGRKVTPTSAWSTYVPVAASSLGTWTLRPGVPRSVPVLGVAGIPSSLVGSVTLRVTAKGAAASTTVTVSPSGLKGVPPTLDVGHGSTVVTTSVITPGSGGAVTLRSPHTVTAEVTVLGYTTRVGAVGSRLVMTDPTVVQGGTSTAGNPVVLAVAAAGVPAGATGVVLALSARAPLATSLRLASVAGGPPVTRMVLPSGHRRSTTVFAPLGAGTTVSISSGRAASVSAVVLGYLVSDDGRQAVGRFQSLAAPTRVWITSARNSLVTGAVRHLPLLGRAGVPTTGVRALLLQVDVIDPTVAGWLAVGGHGDVLTHSVDYLSEHRARGLVVVRPGSRAWVDLVLHGGRAGAAVEILGWWAG